METFFPLEIWEVILQSLSSPDLLRSACVCQQWRHLARRICRLRYQSLPPRLLVELTYEFSTSHSPTQPVHTPPDPARLLPETLLPIPSNATYLSAHTSSTSPTNTSLLPATNAHTGSTCNAHITLDTAHIPPDTAHTPTDAAHIPPDTAHSTSTTPSFTEDTKKGNLGAGGIDWLQVTRMVLQTRLTCRPEECSIVRQVKDVSLLAAAGSFLVLIEKSGDGNVVVRVVGEAGQECHHALTGIVNKVCVLEGGSEPSLVALCVDKELRCLLVAPQLQALSPLPLTPRLTVDSRVCCEGRTLVVSQLVEEYHLSVYRVRVVNVGVGGAGGEGAGVELILLARITTTSPPLTWDLWNGFVTTLLSSGHVSSYTTSGSVVGESPLYKDLRYPNPTLLSRGLVFVSTLTSRTLLSYWHMDRDCDYWLLGESVLTSWVQRGAEAVGNTSCRRDGVAEVSGTSCRRDGADEVSGTRMEEEEGKCVTAGSPREYNLPGSSCMLTLAKVRVGAAVLQEVTVIHYRRGLVFCGTRQGQLLVYNILHEGGGLNNNRKVSGGAAERMGGSECINWGAMESCLPSLCLGLTHCRVSRIVTHFALVNVIVAVADSDGNCQVVIIPHASKL